MILGLVPIAYRGQFLTNAVIGIIADLGAGFLQCSWTPGTLHHHSEDINEQHQVLAGAYCPLQE